MQQANGMPPVLLRADGLTKRIGARTLFDAVGLQLRPDDRVGLVGPNGAGKSTLLRVLAGDEGCDEGAVHVPRSVSLGMLRQEIDPSQEHSVREEAAKALAHLDALEAEIRALEAEIARAGREGGAVPPALAERYDRATTAFTHAGGFAREARVREVLAGLGFDEEASLRPLRSFSGGWLMRVELAKLLLAAPDVLLLDEPTNHLDLPAIQWFEQTLDSFPGAVVVASHDRTFLRRHVGRVAELDGRGRFAVYEGNYDRYLAAREERRAQLEAQKANQDRRVAEVERFVERFRYKASKARQVQSRVKMLEKLERVELEPERARRMRLRIPPPPRSGEVVLRLEDVHKRYGETRVYDGVDWMVRRGERVALVGPNGAGKSTLLRIVAGVLPIDEGDRVPGHNVRPAFFAQHQLEALDPAHTVLEEIAHGAQTGDVPRLRGQLGAFLFSGDDVEKRVAVLSGGEKARLALAKLLLRPANLLVMDEPTNHLDIQACEVLEEALRSYTGTLVFVSHDRSFIDSLATRVTEVQRGVLREFPGNYEDYLRKLAAGEAPDPASGGGSDAAVAPASGGGSDSAAAPAPEARASQPARPTKEERQRERERRKARDRCARRIGELEATILKHEEELEALGWRMGAPDVHSDAERLSEIEAEREALRETIAGHYREWERLADELEALEDVIAS